jgi:DNA-binding Lrp family transcriptional regulator
MARTKKDIDPTDIRIINILQKEAGISSAKLAEKIGLTVSPTFTRVKELKQEGVIVNGRINFEKLGLNQRVYAFFNISPGKEAEFEKQMQKVKYVRSLELVTNGTTFSAFTKYACLIFTSDLMELNANLNTMAKTMDFLAEITVFPVSKTILGCAPIMLDESAY